MTELEAVNQMLLSIGKAPVNSLTTVFINDVAWAQTILYNVTREVQHRGWWFNREANFPITATLVGSQNIFQKPLTVIDWDPSLRANNLVERYNATVTGPGQSGAGWMCMYDMDNHSFDLSRYIDSQIGGIAFDVVWCFPFAQLPHAARSYIMRRAGREFQASAVGSQILYQFTKEMELDSMAELERSETNDSHTNIFTSPNSTNRAFNRQRGYRRSW